MRTQRIGPRVAMLCLSTALVFLNAARAQEPEPADDAAERKVMERFQGVLEKTPRRGTALDRVYGYHVEHGTLDALVKRYDDRTKVDPNDGSAWLLLGLVEAQRGKDAASVAALREADRARPNDPLPSFYLGQSLVLVGQPDRAVEAFERALTRKPLRADLLEIYQALGRVHQRARRADKALEVWARLEASFPDDTRVREQIAAALAEEDQPAQALARYETLARDVKDEYRKVQMAMEAAELKVRLGKAPEALADFEKILGRLNPDAWLFREVRRKIEEVFLRNDDLAGLGKYYEAWIAKTPDDVEAMARLGRTYAQLGRAAEARSWLDKAVKLAPSRRDLRVALIEQLVQEKKTAEAAAQYEALAKAEPGNPDIIRDWGKLLLRDASKPEAERKKEAAAIWKRLAADDVKDPVVIAQAADLFRQAEMVDDAIGLYKRAITMAPDSAQYREYLGEYYHQLKRPADALATWRNGVGKTAAEQGRLGEVLAGFGYRKEALEPLTEAVRLAPDDFDLRLKLADLLMQLDRPADALVQIAAAGKAGDSPEQAEAVLSREIKAFQAGNTLAAQINALRADLDAGKDATAVRWTRLARCYEADGKPPEAVAAISKATAADPKSITAWTTLGRLQESSGNLAAASDANRRLATLDRKARADYLSAIARLEARLGRREEALKAGRELLAAAPGNIDHHQEFAELCFGLGEIDEGLEALRRASRSNPSDPKATNSLADALARQFRTEEAIELYWRSFDRTKDLDGKLGVVARLTEQYLQRNQYDRLISRLERELREPDRKRELTICLAQAYQSAGDLGSARQQLESLLATNTRDTGLLTQLANLSEAEGDVSSAARYLRQVADLSPSPDVAVKLAALHLRAGDTSEAEAVWAKLAAGDADPGRAFSAVDALLAAGKNETVLTLTERMLLKSPNDWDVLYREGIALVGLNKPVEAARRFRAILDLRASDDDLAAIPRSKRKGGGPNASRPVGVLAGRMGAAPFGPAARAQTVWQVRLVTKLDTSRGYSLGSTTWTPVDFGQARMAALGWLYAGSLKEKDPDAWLKARRVEAQAPKADPRTLWDWYYLESVRAEPRETYDAAVRLVRSEPNDPGAEYVFLTALATRASEPTASNRYVSRNSAPAVDKTPPLPPDELKLVTDAFEALRKRRPDLVHEMILANVATELKRARRNAEADAFYRQTVESAATIEAVASVLGLAAERGDVDGLFALADKYDRLQNAATTGAAVGRMGYSQVSIAFSRAMGTKAETKSHADILRLLDSYLAATRRPEQVARRLKAKTSWSNSGQNYMSIYTSKVQNNRSTSVDFPSPNVYFDGGAIQVLRNAYECFLKDDLTSDLIAHVRKQQAAAAGDAKVYPTLELGYLLWWNDDKDDAIREIARAADLVPTDVDLRLGLADLRAQRNEPAEALEAADSVEPLDQKTMQRREILALRLSVLSGDVARARQASERLFGLRLDHEAQVQLAAQMHQLGMHDLAEAVLARARRRAGGNNSALVALMTQYQQQGKADVAVQVANQILRQTVNARQQAQPGYYNEADQARTQAVLVLARSGKLADLIARAEAQLATSPSSIQLLQTLVDYYQANGQKDKVKSTYDRMAKLRPDDAKLRYQIATSLSQAGDAAGSIEHYKSAITKDPNLFMNQYWNVQQAFQQAGKADELIKLYESLDLKTFANNPYIITNSVQNLLQNDKTTAQGMVLFRKAWKDLPEIRPQLLGQLYSDKLWQLPEVYEYAREVVIPKAGKPIANPWEGMAEVMSWDGDGKVSGVLTRLVAIANKQGKLDALSQEAEAALKRSPDWVGGKALLGILRARRGKADEARSFLAEIAGRDSGMPAYARMIVGQELDGVDALKDVELKLYEGAMGGETDEMVRMNGFQYGPGKRLTLLYQKNGRLDDARNLILKEARRPRDNDNYNNPGYSSHQYINNMIGLAGMMEELGYPADAARFYSEIANDTDAMTAAKQWYGNEDYLANQIKTGLERALKPMSKEALERTVRAILTPRVDAKAGEPKLDLVVLCYPRDLDKASVTSQFAGAVGRLGDHPALKAEVQARVAKLVETYPEDVSVLTAGAIVAAIDGKPGELTPAASRLASALEKVPLDVLPPGSRPNARQRDEAARRLGVWIVARDASHHEETRAIGAKIAAVAIEAAARQPDQRWSLAMLRETAQAALDRKDNLAAVATWRTMLKMVLASPSAAKTAPSRPAAIARAPGIVTTTKSARNSGSAIVPMPLGTPPPPKGTTVVTLERFEMAAGLARLAADRGMTPFSLDVVRQALASGPPVTPIAVPNGNQGRMIRMNGNENQADPVSQSVEEHLAALEAAWSKSKADPVAVYEVLREAVLPKARPDEVFLYARPLQLGNLKLPRSVGALLVRWTVRAGKADELKAAIEARQSLPLAKAPAKVLLAQLAFERKNHAETISLLDAIREGMAREGVAFNGELSCHAALPALEVKDTAAAAARVVEASLASIATPNQEEPIGGILVRLAEFEFASGQKAKARGHLLEFLSRMQQSTIRYGGDYGIYRRKIHLARISTEFAKAGQLDDTLDILGQFTDTPATSDYGEGGDVAGPLKTAAHMLSERPVAERFARLKAWTLPTVERRSVRSLVLAANEARPALPFVGNPIVSDGGLLSTVSMLIDAAKSTGSHDALEAEVKPLAAAKVEGAVSLLTRIQLARGDYPSARPAIRDRLANFKTLEANEPSQGNRNAALDWGDYLLARDGLAAPREDDTSVDLARMLIPLAQSNQNGRMLGNLRADLARRDARLAGDAGAASNADPGLALWFPSSTGGEIGIHPGNLGRAVWNESEGLVGHLTGPGQDFLFFNYPLTGTFEFSVDVFTGSWGEGIAGYGGLIFEPSPVAWNSKVWWVGYTATIPRPGTFARGDSFNRLAIRVEPGRVRYLVNGHLFHEDKSPGGTSPWLVLHASRERQTVFRNPRLTGRPEIPRSVALVRGENLDGWYWEAYSESVRVRNEGDGNPTRTDGNGRPISQPRPEDFDWIAAGGEIRGRRNPALGGGGPAPSRLVYFRPLGDGDSLSYEFFSRKGESAVDPGLGLVVFGLDPAGLKLQSIAPTGWVPDHPPQPHELADTAGRRAPIVLKPDAWNAARLTLKGSTLALEINGAIVHEGPIDPADRLVFSLNHDKARTEARVRNVVLAGNWPTELDARQLAKPFVRSESGTKAGLATRRARSAVIGERAFILSARQVAEDARQLPPAERYERLRSWVLPGADHDTFRVAGEFGPTDPPQPPEIPIEPGRSRVPVPPELISPALDLVAVAVATGKLDELAAVAERVEGATPHDRRGRLALIALVREAQGKTAGAEAALKALREIAARSIDKGTPDWKRWPELVAAPVLAKRPALNKTATDVLAELVNQIQRDQIYSPMERQIRNAHGVALALGQPGPKPRIGDDPRVPGWVRGTIPTAESRGQGLPVATWTHDGKEWKHYPGHQNDLMFLAAPIRGDFELDCELTSFNWREARISYAGAAVALRYDLKSYDVQHYGRWVVSSAAINPPLKDVKDWYPFRLVVKGGKLSAYAMGQKIHEQAVAAEADPWLAIFAPGNLTVGVRNLKLSGRPTIPDRIGLSAGSNLTGWIGDYFGESDVWQKKGEEIVGRKLRSFVMAQPPDSQNGRDPSPAETTVGSKHESVLRYVRPIAEDGEVEYEFYYDPGQAVVHPSLDRVAFLLDPDGVKVHRITDGKHETTGIDPGNALAVALDRRGPAALSLKPKAWNHVTLAIKGDRATLSLNGQAIYDHAIESTNARDFGFFYYADESEARVRNVTYRGAWPRTLAADVVAIPATASAR